MVEKQHNLRENLEQDHKVAQVLRDLTFLIHNNLQQQCREIKRN